MEYSLLRCNGSHPGFRKLIIELDRHLRSFKSDHEDIYISHNIVSEDVCVSLVLLGNQPVGCACLRHYKEGTFELKRMFVQKEHRGKGLSRRILQDLEEWAVSLGYTTILLETGKILKEAHELYRSSGFTIIENYGPYMGVPESLCFEKKLKP